MRQIFENEFFFRMLLTMPQRVTMADVAREAGVSLMTVSRVVNHKDGISEATRQRVQHIIDRLGYRPSDIARSLVTDRTGTIGLVVIDNANPFFSEVARGVEHVAYAEGYNVFLCNTNEDIQRELAVLRSLEEKRVDGLVLCSSRLDDNALLNTLVNHAAVVLINRRLDDVRFGSIEVNDVRGGQLAVEHLIARGHKAIGMLAGPQNSYSGQLRARGYRIALAAANLPYRPEWMRHCLPFVDSGYRAAHDLLTAHSELTALFCYNDLSAVGAMQACQELERRVPDDLAVMGFDDVPLASWVTPALTTCRVPMYDMGRQAMCLLLDYINYPDGHTGKAFEKHLMIEPKLVIRASAP
jgi:LacI family transcriptional regulator